MPVTKGKSQKVFDANVKQLMSEIGKSPHVKNQRQALAIAYDVQRRSGGGKPPQKGGKK